MATSITLTVAGRSLQVSGVELFPSPAVAEWRGLLATAQQQLGGVSTGIGFLGSPEWAIGGAIALGAIEAALSSSKAKEGVRTLERANDALADIRRSGIIYLVSQIRNIEIPNPAAWTGVGDGFRSQEIGKIAFLDRAKFLRENGLTKSDVEGGVVQVPTSVAYVPLEEDFVTLSTPEGLMKVRWTSVDTYVVDDGASGRRGTRHAV